MWAKMMTLWRCACQPTSFSAAGTGSLFASYHTGQIISSSGNNPAVKRLRWPSNKPSLQSKPVITSDEATQSKVWSNEMPLRKNDYRGAAGLGISSELKKLSLDDYSTAERDRTVKQRTKLDIKADSFEFVFGVSPCLLALTKGRRKIRALFVKSGDTSLRASVLKVCEEAHRLSVPIHRVSKRDLDKMTEGRVHQGLCLQASPLTYVTEEIDTSIHRKDKNIPLWLVIESVQDPMNLGAILRSAYFLGVNRVVSSISQSCPLSPVVSKASSGVMEVMEVYGYKNIGEMLKIKIAQGWDLVGTVGSESEEAPIRVTKCSDFTVTKPTLLLIGGEGGGLSQELLSHCQTILTIPAGRQLFPGIESLNVSVATGILLHSLLGSR